MCKFCMYTVITGIPVNCIYINTEQQRKYYDLLKSGFFFYIIIIKKNIEVFLYKYYSTNMFKFSYFIFTVSFDAIIFRKY